MQHIRYRYDFFGALLEHIDATGRVPIQITTWAYYQLEPADIGLVTDGRAYHHHHNPDPQQVAATIVVSDDTRARVITTLEEKVCR